MPDFEPQSLPQESVVSPEQKTNSKFRVVAEQLGSHTRNIIDNIGEIGSKLLERTWYTHSTSLLFLESIAAKTLSLAATPEIRSKGKMIGVDLWTSGIAALLEEDVIKSIKNKVNFGEHMSVHLMGKVIVAQVGWKNRQWGKYQSKFKSAREAFISREKLIELYGEKNLDENQANVKM